ncbi:MAG: hypothetical protein H0U75_11110 [Legionella sp.]|nr:hypothetical protein [Legionella sp.]
MKKDLKADLGPKRQSINKLNNGINEITEKKAISAIQLHYAEVQIEQINLNAEDKEQKLTKAHKVVEILANSLGAKGLLQNLLVTQLLGVHELQQKLLSCANRAMNYPEHSQYYVNALTKLSNAFIQQINTLQKLQGNSQQKVVVEHLHINDGGQAIVGQVNTKGVGQ